MKRLYALLVLATLVGCADILGLGDYTDASVADVGPDATMEAAADVQSDTSDASDAEAGCTTGATADAAAGIFVAPTGMDTTTCGSEALPCQTIQKSLDRANLIGRSIVYVARGTYTEAVTLYPGLELQGGWDDVGGTWAQSCNNPQAAVVIQSPGPDATVTAEDLGGTATLTTLTIMSKSSADAGESLYGVFATGATTNLVMNDVVVRVAGAGDGSPGGLGATGDAGGACNTPGDGGGGMAGNPGSGAEAGGFAANGWNAQSGTAGNPGTAAQAGHEGADGGCVTCGSCSPCLLCCNFNASGSSCGGAGFPGCGGGPGGGGMGGGGGGSSVGVFVWDATVTLNGGSIQAGAGGAGGSGGVGGVGGNGGSGKVGDAGVTCTTSCGSGCSANTSAGSGGAAGSSGGTGGNGGAGGGGAGGCSYAIYQGGDAGTVMAATTPLAHAEAGVGGGPDGAAGASGLAADRFP